MTFRKTSIFLFFVLVGGFILSFMYLSPDLSRELLQTKTVTTDDYTFKAPNDWIESALPQTDCPWYFIANDSSDGHRMAGEIGIYPIRCFDLANAGGYQQISSIDGYYVLAYYDAQTGTTEAEIAETKTAFDLVTKSFKKN